MMISILTIFLGSLLVFLVQPLVSNTLLPYFGGAASVWTASLATFQLLLIGGYYYADRIGSSIGHNVFRSRSISCHLVILLLIAAILFAIAGNYARIIRLVAEVTSSLNSGVVASLTIICLVGVPYIVLSSNSSLVQAISGGKYKLYAVSNLGSMIGLLIYPFVFEPFLRIRQQWLAFAVIVAVYVALFLVLSLSGINIYSTQFTESDAESFDSHSAESESKPKDYFILAFFSCFLLNAISTHLCSDITPLPLMWVILLAIYLLTYIISFTDIGSSIGRWAAIPFLPTAFYAVYHLGVLGWDAFNLELVLGSMLLFFGGWIVHSRLYRIRPGTNQLTRYYLLIALGGAAGGAVCSFVAPMIFNTIAEYPIALAAVILVVINDFKGEALKHGIFIGKSPMTRYAMLTAIFLFAAYGIFRGMNQDAVVLTRYRNFYGHGNAVLTRNVFDNGDYYEVHQFRSNGTNHGFQCIVNGELKRTPTTYYTDFGGGMAILSHPKRIAKKSIRAAFLGMGVACMATHGNEGDYFRYFEINPAVAKLAQDKQYFNFLELSPATNDVVIDDARHALELERDRNVAKYDVIIVDVFNGDSIPPHMATKEAFQLYLDRLDEDGILAFHITNWYLDLKPIVKAAGKEFGLNVECYESYPAEFANESCWAFFSRKQLALKTHRTLNQLHSLSNVKDVPLMTDDHYSILPYISLSQNSD